MQKIILKLFEIEKLIRENSKRSKEILLLDEAAEFLGISKSCLYKLTCNRRIDFYRPSKKIYFKREDLVAFMLKNRKPQISQ